MFRYPLHLLPPYSSANLKPEQPILSYSIFTYSMTLLCSPPLSIASYTRRERPPTKEITLPIIPSTVPTGISIVLTTAHL